MRDFPLHEEKKQTDPNSIDVEAAVEAPGGRNSPSRGEESEWDPMEASAKGSGNEIVTSERMPLPRQLNTNPAHSQSRTLNVFPNSLKADVDIDLDKLPRLVLRNRAYHQSSNKVHIQHNKGIHLYSLLRHNLFHVVLRWPARYSMPILLSVWTGAILLFAGLYMAHDRLRSLEKCGLGADGEFMHFPAAFAFSLETCTTVGYGLPNGVNSYFEKGCGFLQFIIYVQMAWSMIFNAFLITFLYNRIGRSETRGSQVIFSNKALVSIVDGQIRFQIRLFDCDARHPVVEAHVRLYCVMKHRPVPRPLRVLQPNDELGGMLFLSFPTVINHDVDMYSLLYPPTEVTRTTAIKPKGLVLRQVDGSTGNREDVVCPICGEGYGTLKRWFNHVRYCQIVEKKEDYPLEGTHLELNLDELVKLNSKAKIPNLDEYQQYFKKNVSEIICLVEGIDPMQSGTFQALQSYRFEDIVWEPHYQFAPCLTVVDDSSRKSTMIYSVDLDRYHDIVEDPEALELAEERATMEEALKSSAVKKPQKRHRRIKTLSSRASDCLFAKNASDLATATDSKRTTDTIHSIAM